MKPVMKVLLFCLALSISSIFALCQLNKPINVKIGELAIVQNGSHYVYVLDFWHGKRLEKVIYRTSTAMEADIYALKNNKRVNLTFIDPLTENEK